MATRDKNGKFAAERVADPTDCLENGFFFWTLSNGQELKYEIEESKTFAE